MRRYGRREPYTAVGIWRLPCYRCGAPASQQWNACADGNLWHPVCIACDVALNALTLWFLRMPKRERQRKMAAYRRKVGA